MNRRYELGEDVLPNELLGRVKTRLNNKKTVVTFRVFKDAPLTPSEKSIGDVELVMEVRDYLTRYDTKSKCVYFKGTNKKGKKTHPDKIYAEKLLELGHTQQIVGDIIGVSRITVCRWFKSALPRGRPENIDLTTIDYSSIEYVAGVEWLCENADPFVDIDIWDEDDVQKALELLAEQTKLPIDRITKRAYFIGKAVTDLKAIKC